MAPGDEDLRDVADPRHARSWIQERSPQTTSVGHRGHGGACAAISLHATITAAGRRTASGGARPGPRRGARAPPPRASSRGVVNSDPSARRASIASSALPNETSAAGAGRRARRRRSGRCAARGRAGRRARRGRDGAPPALRRACRRSCGPSHAAPGDAERVGGLDEIGDVLLDAPRRLPARAAVAAVVDADHAIGRRAAPRRAARKRRPWPVTPCRQSTGAPRRISPLRDVQLHESTSLPKCAPVLDRSSAAAASASGRTWIDHGPPRAALERAQEAREVGRAAHHRPEQRELPEVERPHRQASTSVPPVAPKTTSRPPGPQALERLRPGRADGVDHEVGAAALLRPRRPSRPTRS